MKYFTIMSTPDLEIIRESLEILGNGLLNRNICPVEKQTKIQRIYELLLSINDELKERSK